MPAFRGLSIPSVRLVLSYVFDWICIMYVNGRVPTPCQPNVGWGRMYHHWNELN